MTNKTRMCIQLLVLARSTFGAARGLQRLLEETLDEAESSKQMSLPLDALSGGTSIGSVNQYHQQPFGGAAE